MWISTVTMPTALELYTCSQVSLHFAASDQCRADSSPTTYTHAFLQQGNQQEINLFGRMQHPAIFCAANIKK
jgi:hypothetical protein